MPDDNDTRHFETSDSIESASSENNDDDACHVTSGGRLLACCRSKSTDATSQRTESTESLELLVCPVASSYSSNVLSTPTTGNDTFDDWLFMLVTEQFNIIFVIVSPSALVLTISHLHGIYYLPRKQLLCTKHKNNTQNPKRFTKIAFRN